MHNTPGGIITRRPLHFIWIADSSGSMTGDKIQSLNTAIRESIPFMDEAARSNPEVEVLVRAVGFSTGARWHIADLTPIAHFHWPNMVVGGETHLGAALTLVADALHDDMPTRALRPVLVLLTDGHPTDDYRRGLDALLTEPWGAKAVRLAISIGQDADPGPLQEFVSSGEYLFQANNSEMLAQCIRWASTAVVRGVSSPTLEHDKEVGPGMMTIPDKPDQLGDDIW